MLFATSRRTENVKGVARGYCSRSNLVTKPIVRLQRNNSPVSAAIVLRLREYSTAATRGITNNTNNTVLLYCTIAVLQSGYGNTIQTGYAVKLLSVECIVCSV